MAANVVRADYDQLTQSAATFAQQAEQARKSYQGLRQTVELLQAGDWLGEGAQAFYAEMNGQVLPTMQRLFQALEQAADTTRKINQIAQQAEREAAACLQVDGTGASPGAAIGAAAANLGVGGAAGVGTTNGAASAAPVGAGAAGFVGGQAGPNGGGGAAPPDKAKAPLKAPVAPKVNGAADKQGQAAYAQYLVDYSKYLRQESQNWNWKTVEQKANEQLQQSVKLARALDSQLHPVLKELFAKDGKGIADPALRQKALDLITQQQNLVQKAQTERLIVEDRAVELFTATEAAAAKDKVITDAERKDISHKMDIVESLRRPLQLNNDIGEFLIKRRASIVQMQP